MYKLCDVRFMHVDYAGRILQIGREMAMAEVSLNFTLDNEEWEPSDMTFDEAVIDDLDRLVGLWMEYRALSEPSYEYYTIEYYTIADGGASGNIAIGSVTA